MESNTIRSFAAGLIVAAGLLGIVYYAGGNGAATTEGTTEKTTQTADDNLSEEEMKESLTSAGYVVFTKDEWAKKSKTLKEEDTAKEADTPKKSDTTKESDKTKDQYSAVLTVTSGMTSIDVGNVLKQMKIIDDPYVFANIVEQRGLANRLTLGSYEINNSMTADDIIAKIYKQ